MLRFIAVCATVGALVTPTYALASSPPANGGRAVIVATSPDLAGRAGKPRKPNALAGRSTRAGDHRAPAAGGGASFPFTAFDLVFIALGGLGMLTAGLTTRHLARPLA